jgi:4-hydroxy-3-methylbut-2-enyl diphosphate reductase
MANFLDLSRPVRIGLSSGASTPDSAVQDVLDAVIMLKKLGLKATVPA